MEEEELRECLGDLCVKNLAPSELSQLYDLVKEREQLITSGLKASQVTERINEITTKLGDFQLKAKTQENASNMKDPNQESIKVKRVNSKSKKKKMIDEEGFISPRNTLKRTRSESEIAEPPLKNKFADLQGEDRRIV